MSDTRAPATRRPQTTEVVVAVGVAALGVSLFLSPDHIEDGPVICPVRRLTGLPCPGCGLTRSWVYLAHGWWRESFLAHPFGPLFATVVVALGVAVVLARVRRTAPPSLDRIVKHPVAVVVLGAWLGFALVRAVLAA
ncbi:DUF2752 domain-containing protein [Nocardioides carbamazepini]|uniref:DUF2752 domain-containing protein n=1 Tax=Nocardioides carbamazepini TaxID=2854259 RepID=UPI00214A6B29|nr:DUF2752 domain-containing protein [Nocardioides carbamazepini]MCR1785424.1 DUF2752 domain-containing protein [Nocardioides carbamazepini]